MISSEESLLKSFDNENLHHAENCVINLFYNSILLKEYVMIFITHKDANRLLISLRT